MLNKCLPFDEPGSLMATTRKLLKDDPRGIVGVHDATSLPFYWLLKFAAGSFKNPSVNRVQFLYEKLAARRLL